MKQTSQTVRALPWLLAKCRKQVPLLSIVVFCNVFFAASSVALALLVREVIDCATAALSDPATLARLYTAAYYGALLIVFQLVMRFLCRYLQDKLTANIEMCLRTDLYRTLLSRDFGKVSAYHSGELMTCLYSDVTVIADAASTILPNLAAIGTRLVCAVGVMAFLEWRFTLLFVVGGLIVYFASRLFSGRLKTLHLRTQEADGRARSFLQESFSSLLVLKAFDAQDATGEKAEKLQREYVIARLKKYLLGAWAGVSFAAVFKIGYFAALFYCSLSLAGAFESGIAMTYGTLMAILQLVNQIQTPLGSLSGVLPKYFGMCASIGRLSKLEVLPSERREECPIEDVREFYGDLRELRFEDLTFSYDGENVIEGASFTINRGDFCVITGLSGIGKSTLLKLLLGVYEPSSGKIVFSMRDADLSEVSVFARPRGLFAYVPQGNLLFSGTIRENISFVCPTATEEEILKAAELACVTDFLSDLPAGLDTVIGEKGFGLSEGQVQRISIARALLLGAPILLLDESTSALDEETESKLLGNLAELDDRTLVIISHKRAAFDICDYELVISGKKVQKKELMHDAR